MESKYLLNNIQDTEAFLTANNIAFHVSARLPADRQPRESADNRSHA